MFSASHSSSSIRLSLHSDGDEGDEEEEEGGGMGEDDDVDTEEQETLQRVQNGKDPSSSGKSVADNDLGKSTKSKRRGKLVVSVYLRSFSAYTRIL